MHAPPYLLPDICNVNLTTEMSALLLSLFFTVSIFAHSPFTSLTAVVLSVQPVQKSFPMILF